jgi:hypothetical protein
MTIFENCLFFKMTLLKNCISVKINAMLHIIFAAAAVEILHGVATGRERGGGGRAGSSYKLDAAGVTKISFFSILWTFRAASS